MEWAPEAEPQSSKEASRAPRCPEVVRAAKNRGITNRGGRPVALPLQA